MGLVLVHVLNFLHLDLVQTLQSLVFLVQCLSLDVHLLLRVHFDFCKHSVFLLVGDLNNFLLPQTHALTPIGAIGNHKMSKESTK